MSQVRTAEFDKEIHERIRQELALAEQKALNEQQEKLAKKDQEIAQLQNQIQQFDTEKELAKKEVEQTASQSLLEKEKEVQALENQLATLRLEHENQLQKTLSDLEKERDQVKDDLHKSALTLSGGQQQRLCIAREMCIRDRIEENPSLLRRPIILDNKRMQIGFNEDEIRAFLPRSYRKQELRLSLIHI